MAKPAQSAADRKKALIDDQEYLSKEEKEAAKAKIDEKEKQDKAAEQAKAYKEADLIGAKDAEKLSKTSTKNDSSSRSSAKKTSSTGKTNLGTSKQAAGDYIARAAGAEKGIRKIEAAKTEKATAQAMANKEADLPGFDGRAAQKAYQQKVEQEKTEYLNTKEARDKKYALEQELAKLKAQAKNQTKEAGTVAIVASGRKGANTSFVLPETQKRIEELEKQISDLNKNITLASRAQEKKYLYNRASGAEDFSEYSKEPQKEEPAAVRPHQQNIGRETETLKGYMTEEERAVYNYYFNKFGEAKAEEFFESIEEDLNFRQAQAIFAGNEGKVFNEYIQGAVAGLEDAKEGYKGTLNMLLGIDEEQPTSTYDFLSGMAREDLGKSGIKLPEVLGGASLGQIGFDVVNTTANMLPSIMLGTLGGSAAGAVGIGASAAGNAYNEAIKAGYDKEQATNYAALVGASEASLGYLLGGIEATGGKIGKAAMAKVLPKIDNALAKAAVNVGGKMLSEFSEEYLQEVLSPVFENIALMEENEIDLLSPEAIYSGILGALSAGGIAVFDGSANVPEILQKAEVPVPFDGKVQPGTEAALVADKITEIENRPISEAEKAAKMEEVMEKAAQLGTEPGLVEEAEKFRDIHEERVAVGAGQYYFDEKANDYVIKDDFGNPKYRNDIITEEILKDDKNLGEKSPFGKNFEEWIKNNHDPVKTVSVAGKDILPESIKFSDISAFVKGLVKKGEFYKGKVKNEYSGFEIHIGANGLNETARNAQLQKNKASAEALKNIKELVENAVLIGAHDVDVSQKNVSKKNKPQRLYQYIFACPYIKNGTENVAIIRADRIYDGDNTIRNFYNLKSIETVATNPEFRLSRPAGNAATIYSIADLANVVNEQYLGYRSSYEYQKKNIFDTKIIDKILGIESNPELNTPPSIGNNVFGAGIFGNQNSKTAPHEKSNEEFYAEILGLEDTVPSFVRADINRIVDDPSITNEQKFFDLMALYDSAKTPAEKSEIGRYIYMMKTMPTERKPFFGIKNKASSSAKNDTEQNATFVPEREIKTPEGINLLQEEVETNIGKMPVEDYREILAAQNGFNSYEEMQAEARAMEEWDRKEEEWRKEQAEAQIKEIIREGRSRRFVREETKAEPGASEFVSAEISDSAKRVLEQMAPKIEKQSSTSQVNPESESTNLVDVPQSEKSKRIERRYQRAVEEGVASVFGIDRSDIREDIRPILEEISAEVKDGNKISDKQIDRLYKTAFESGYITEEFPQYEETRKYIRSTPIFVDEATRHEFGDDFEFRDFARSNFGSIKISSDPRSRHLDDFYKSLSETEPGFFSEEEIDPRTQLENIADFMQQTKKQYYGLLEVYSGTKLSDFEAWAKKELRAYMDDFGKGLDTVVRYERDRQIKATNKAREIDRTTSFEQAKAAFEGNRVFEAQKAMEKAKANALLNDNDLLTVKRLHEGTLNEADVLALGGNVEGILEVYRTEKAYRQARAPFDRYKAAYKTALLHDAVQFTELSDEWTDKKIGFEYSRETAERNVRDIAGKGGERVISEYFAPVHENEAMKIRWIKEMNQRVADLELGKMNRYERAYAQMIGENAAYIAEGKLTKHNQAEHDALNERISVLLSEHGKKIDKAKCEKAAAGFMDIYKDIREEWNDERIRRGQEPIGEIENYFPHFLETKPETLIQKFFSLFGFDISSSKLPTDIAGRTADRKPNSRYNPHANRRTSDITDYDILKGFDGYVRAVGDNIFHTEDIQKLRALSDTIRTKYSSAETEKRIEEIRNREDLSEADKETLIADVFKAEPGAYHLSNFVVWLDEYTNILAGKKSRGDREAEYQMGREIYDVSKALEGRIASNMIGYNLSTPVMNFVPMFQATADVSPVDIVSSFLQTGVAAVKGDSFISDNSDFLTNRFGVDSVYKKNYSLFSSENMKDFVSKVSDGGAFLMEYVDRIVSESLVRARYEQNIKKGLDKVTAFSEADQWAAGLIADRSLGALPTVFNIKNPVAKAVTMFQVEANNQYSYIFKDAGKYKWKSEGAFNTIAGQLAFWAAMAICNGLADELLGRDNVVPDPIGMTAEAIEKIQKGEKIGDVALDTATNIVEQIPFVGGLLGGGRIPISTALPDFEQSLKLLNPEVSWDKKGQIIRDELFKPMSYILFPSGAGQLWKTGKGIGQLAQGGAYGMENDGSEYLKFPQEYDPESIIKTVLFGQYASDRGQEYIDSNFKSLSAKDTANMELAEEYGLSKQEFYDTILGLREFDKKEEKQEAILQNENLDAREKSVIDWILFGKQDNFPESTRDYTSPEAFYRSGLETGELRLYEDGYGREEIDKIETALEKGGTKVEDVAAIQKALGCTEAEAFEIYQRRNGNWIDDAHYFTDEQEERAKGAADFYNMSTDDYLAVLNYSKFGTVVTDENGEESYSTKMEDVLPKIMEATGWDEETAKKNYLMVNKYEYSREDIEEAQTFDLDTSQSWYEVEDKGYFVARNVLKTVEGTKDEYGNTVSGSKKEAAVKEIAKQLGIDEEEATIYYLAANGDLVLSEDDLSSSQIEDMKAAVAEGWTERQFLDAVNVVKLSGATKKDDIIKALKDAGATDEMARGYYNLRQNYDYDKVTSSGAKTYSYGMKNQKQVDKANYYLENYNGGGELSSNDLAKWFAAAEGCKKKQEYIDAYMSAGATYSQALKFYNLMRGYDDDFNAWYKENGG